MEVLTVKEAVERVNNGGTLKGVVLDENSIKQVNVRDAMVLSRGGIVIPEQNIYYDDADIAYDPDIDDVQWVRLPSSLTLEDLARMAEEFEHSKEGVHSGSNEISIKLKLDDEEAVHWATTNYDTIRQLLNRIVSDPYKARTIIEK